MTEYEAQEAMRTVLDELRKKYVPDEDRDRNARGALGFDYGYHQALAEVESRLYIAFREKVPA